jgi:hypothetical protein
VTSKNQSIVKIVRNELVELAASPKRSSAPFALSVEGKLLINIDVLDIIDPAALEGRCLFVGAELDEVEQELAAKVLTEAGHDLRAQIAWAMAKERPPKPDSDPETGTETEPGSDPETEPEPA